MTTMSWASDKPTLVFGIFKQECFDKYSNGEFIDGACAKHTFSKILGLLIVALSFFLKVPQIVKIFKNWSVQGINPMMYYLETWATIAISSMSIHLNLGYSLYGD